MTHRLQIQDGGVREERTASVRLEILDEQLQGAALVSMLGPSRSGGPGRMATSEPLSVGMFPAPEAWLAHVVPY